MGAQKKREIQNDLSTYSTFAKQKRTEIVSKGKEILSFWQYYECSIYI